MSLHLISVSSPPPLSLSPVLPSSAVSSHYNLPPRSPSSSLSTFSPQRMPCGQSHWWRGFAAELESARASARQFVVNHKLISDLGAICRQTLIFATALKSPKHQRPRLYYMIVITNCSSASSRRALAKYNSGHN